LDYKISGDILQTVDMTLKTGDRIYCEAGALAWMSDNVLMETKAKGGIMKSIGRAFTGESFFLVEYFVNEGDGVISLAAEYPGKTIPFELKEGESVVCQKDAFLAAENTVAMEVFFQKKIGAGLFGGEGFIMQKLTGPGKAFASVGGEILSLDLEQGQKLKVNPGFVAAMQPEVKFDIQRINGIKNILFGGEGLFLATLEGPGKVWLQTMPISHLAAKIAEFIRVPKSGQSKGGGGGITLGPGGLGFKI